MIIKLIPRMIVFFVFLICSISVVWAGQVVTDNERQWAREAIANEKQNTTTPSRNTLGILYFENKTQESRLRLLQKGLTLMLTTDLSKVEGLQLVERVKLQALLEELKLQNSVLVSASEKERLCHLLQAEFILGGDILHTTSNNYQFRSYLLNMNQEKPIGQSSVDGKLLNKLFEMEKKLLFSIVKMLRISLTDDQKAELKKPMITSVEAFMYFMQAIDASDTQDYDQAVKLYRKALEKDPNFSIAQKAVIEIQTLGLAGKVHKMPELLQSLRKRTSKTKQIETENLIKRTLPPAEQNSSVIVSW